MGTRLRAPLFFLLTLGLCGCAVLDYLPRDYARPPGVRGARQTHGLGGPDPGACVQLHA